jgi:hypothetical protein
MNKENTANGSTGAGNTTKNNTSTKKSGPFTNKGKKTTPRGYMPPSMLKRFGLKENRPNLDTGEETDRRFTIEQNRWIKRMTQQVVTYRMLGQCKTETRLPAPIRNTIKYFSYPIVGTGGGAPTMAQSGPEDGADPTKTTLKV